MLYVFLLNRSLVSIGGLLRRWVEPSSCPLSCPLLGIARNIQIVDWRRPVGVWVVDPPWFSSTEQSFVRWWIRLSTAGQYRYPLNRTYSVPCTIGRSGTRRRFRYDIFGHRALPPMSGTCIGVRGGYLLSVSRGPGEIAWPLRLVEWRVPVGVDCRAYRTWRKEAMVGDWCGPTGRA